MNVTTNVIDIAAPAERIYALAAATERWPAILPHYRFVRVLADDGVMRTVRMAAWRDCFPIAWTARQINDPQRPHIAFHHIAGATRGMDVEWRFEPIPGATRVTIEHRLVFQFPVFADAIGRTIVSDYFIHGVATKTLARIKQLAEAGGA